MTFSFNLLCVSCFQVRFFKLYQKCECMLFKLSFTSPHCGNISSVNDPHCETKNAPFKSSFFLLLGSLEFLCRLFHFSSNEVNISHNILPLVKTIGTYKNDILEYYFIQDNMQTNLSSINFITDFFCRLSLKSPASTRYP